MKEDELTTALKKLVLHLRILVAVQAMADFLMVYSFIKLLFFSTGSVNLFGRELSQGNATTLVILIGLIDLTLTMIRRNDLKYGRTLLSEADRFSNDELTMLIERFKRFK